jgi:hypothetical protein
MLFHPFFNFVKKTGKKNRKKRRKKWWRLKKGGKN